MKDRFTKKKAIAARLCLARKQAGLSQEQVADMIRLHRPSISEIEAGRRNVTAEELAKLSKIYDVSVNWLACENTASIDVEKDKVELAARKLATMKKQDIEKILNLLRAIKREESSK